MSNAFGSLNDDEIKQMARLIEALEQSTFDYLQLEVGDLKVTIGKGSVPPNGVAPTVSAAAAPAAAPAPQLHAAPRATPQAAPPAQPAKDEATAADGTVAITAPIIGRYYAQPEPGAPPFVTVGATVTEDTTVGLIEVMKTFNAVRAGVSGVIAELCVADAQLVEYGQVLFRVRPAAKAS